MTMNYETIKQIAKDQRMKVTDLIALAPKNDPFYCGAPGQVKAAEWFAKMYSRVGGTHLRRIHYRIWEGLPEHERKLPYPLTTKLELANGQKKEITLEYYDNYQRCWDWLTEAAKYARYLDLVPVNAFVDNRAKESSFSFYARWPQEGDWDYEDATPKYEVTGEWDNLHYELPEIPELDGLPYLLDLPTFGVSGYDAIQQPYHIEIWIEKSEGEDIMLPLCQRYGLNLIVGVGEMSISTTYRFAERARKANRPAKILYISDFDPSGYNMPVGVARKVEHFIRNYGFYDLDVTLEPVLLTKEQVIEYGLPPKPVKDSDPRKSGWEAAHGGAVELNALFATDERVSIAQRIITDAILQYYDTSLTRRAREQRRKLTEALATEQRDIIALYADEWKELEQDYSVLCDDIDAVRAEFDDAVRPFRDKIETFRDRLEEIKARGSILYENVADSLNDVDLDAEEEFPLPKPDLPEVDDVLFASERDYFIQLEYYKAHQDNGNG